MERESVMAVKTSTVVHLHLRAPDEALERLNRITGLRFSQWPQSLLDNSSRQAVVSEQPSRADASPQATHGDRAADLCSG